MSNERPQYMRTTMLPDGARADDDHRYFVDNPTIDAVLDGIERLSAKGYQLDTDWRPYMVGDVEHGGYVLRGSFLDVSAAFSVQVPHDRAREVWDRICAVDIMVRRMKP